jgi:hypothetical protein
MMHGMYTQCHSECLPVHQVLWSESESGLRSSFSLAVIAKHILESTD